MLRPVLVDLPIDRFLHPVSDDANLPNPSAGSKRSISPSLARSIFSPAKRRILEQDGLFLPSQSHPSPSTTPRSLRSPRGSLLHAFDHPKRPVGAGLGDMLPSPPGNSHAPVPPPSRVSRRVSPRLSTTPQSRSLPTPTTLTRTSPRKTRSQTTPTPTPTSTTPQRVRPTSTSTPSSPMPAAKATMVPREMPPPPDRRSAHYPGFDVHHDSHVALPCTRSKAHARAEAARLQVQEGESVKENVCPAASSSMAMAMATFAAPLMKGKVKGDVVPRRSARLRTNNNGCAPSQKAVVVAGYGRRWRTLHDSSLQF